MKKPNHPFVSTARLEASRARSNRARAGHARAAAFPLALLASAAPAAAAPPTSSDALALQAQGDPTEEDPILKFAKENNFGGIVLAESCASVSDGGETLDGAGVQSLPVGAGRRLECLLDVGSRVTQFLQDSTGALWCQLGQLVDTRTNALDDRLDVTIEDAPSSGPWSVVATHAGEEITIIRASGVWPLGVETNYATIDLQPSEGRACEEIFGL